LNARTLAGSHRLRTPISIDMKRNVPPQPPVNRLAHEVMLGISRLDAGGVDRFRAAFRAFDIG